MWFYVCSSGVYVCVSKKVTLMTTTTMKRIKIITDKELEKSEIFELIFGVYPI